MSKRISAGLILYDFIRGKWRVLLAHPGGPYFRRKDKGHWSIPKGEVDEGEDRLSCAIREFEEETGHSGVSDQYIELGTITQKGGKIVYAWAFRGQWNPAHFRSNEFTMVWPPKSGQYQSFPEVDRAELMDFRKAAKFIKPTQIPLLNRLEEELIKT